MKIEDRKKARVVFQTNFFLPYVPVYDKTKKEIVSMSPGKSVDMTDINQGHNIVN